MPSLVADLLRDLGAACEEIGVEWYLFGAQAALLHGSTRLTADVDATVALEAVPAREFVRVLSKHGFSTRFSDESFIEMTRVVPVVHDRTGLPADLVLAGPGPEQLFLQRAVWTPIEELSVPVATAEDIIVMKILAGRPKDLEDVGAIVAAQRHRLDREHVEGLLHDLEEALAQSDLLPVWHRFSS